jgi:hypothetical protein
MQTIEKSALFTELTVEESAEINGACRYFHNPCWNPCWSPCSSGWGGGSGGYGYGYSGSSAVTQTTNVNVLIDD